MLLGLVSSLLVQLASSVASLEFDAIRPIPAKAPARHLRWQPQLNYGDARLCTPYPAVDASGQIGSVSGERDCAIKPEFGQAYSREGHSNGNFGIMYVWYFPYDFITWTKLQPRVRAGDPRFYSVVVWFTNEKSNEPFAITYSDLAEWLDDTRWARTKDNHILIMKVPGALYTDDNALSGDVHPLISWENMPVAAQHALVPYKWGDDWNQKFPLSGFFFQSTLDEAWKGLGH